MCCSRRFIIGGVSLIVCGAANDVDRFHPAIQRVKAILDSGELGTVQHIAVNLATPKGFIKPSDIRFDYGLGGGAMMDMGCAWFLSA